MTSLRRALWALAAAGFAFGLAVLALILTSDSADPPGAWGAAALLVGWSFIGVGLFAWGRRPDNRVGMLMVATGFAWLMAASGFSDLPLVFTLGNLLGSVFFAVAIHLLLAFRAAGSSRGRSAGSWGPPTSSPRAARIPCGCSPIPGRSTATTAPRTSS
jgi:hypothetical protein